MQWAFLVLDDVFTIQFNFLLDVILFHHFACFFECRYFAADFQFLFPDFFDFSFFLHIKKLRKYVEFFFSFLLIISTWSFIWMWFVFPDELKRMIAFTSAKQYCTELRNVLLIEPENFWLQMDNYGIKYESCIWTTHCFDIVSMLFSQCFDVFSRWFDVVLMLF